MIKVRSRYGLLGLALMTGGAAFAIVAWLILDFVPLIALGMSAVILGGVALALGRSLPRVSPEASMVFLEAGFENIATLVEELGLRSRALYLPVSRTDGRPRALIPLQGNSVEPNIQQRLERRLIVRFGPGPEDFGVLVATPGSAALGLSDLQVGSSSGDLETALSALLVGALDLVEGVHVRRNGRELSVEVARLVLHRRNHPAYAILGSPVASIVATLAAQSLDRPVSVMGETDRGRWHIIELEVLEEAL